MTAVVAEGLTTSEAAGRRAEHGPNRLPAPRRPSAARRLAGELTHFFAVMLWVAGLLALIAGLPELGIAIFDHPQNQMSGADLEERRGLGQVGVAHDDMQPPVALGAGVGPVDHFWRQRPEAAGVPGRGCLA